MPLKSAVPLSVYQTPEIDGETVLLKIPWYPYEQTEWCWAACAQMIAFYFQQSLTAQCTLAGVLFPARDCCQDPAACNQPIKLADVEKLLVSFGKSANFVPAPVQFQDIKSEILAGRPVQVGFAWSSGGNHIAVVAGVSEDGVGPLVYVNDPDPDFANGWVYFSNLQLAYGYGSWQWTWTSIQ